MITQTDIDSAVAQIEALRGPLDDALRVDTRQLDTQIRGALLSAARRGLSGAPLVSEITRQMDMRANPNHTVENPDADKRIHERERQFGSEVIQIVNRLKAKL